MGEFLADQGLVFAGSLVGVLVLVMLTWALGFRQQGRLESTDEASELMRLAPGGFEPLDIALDHDGRAALARDATGRWLVLLAHGNQFVARPVSRADIRIEDGKVLVTGEGRTTVIAPEASCWLLTDIDDN